MKHTYIICLLLFAQISNGQECLTSKTIIDHVIVTEGELNIPPNTENPSTTPPPKDERIVGFLHGIAGSVDTWEKVRTHFWQTYEVNTPHLEYSQTGIHDAAYDINAQLKTFNDEYIENPEIPDYTVDKTYLIAHSLGGIVGRRMEANYDLFNTESWNEQYNGMITFGTPHQGTFLVGNKNKVKQFASEGCDVLSEAYVGEFVANFQIPIPILGAVLRNIARNITLGSDNQDGFIEDFVCDKIVSLGAGHLLDQMIPPIGESLHPESDNMIELSNNLYDMPIVSAYGLEDDPVSLRQAYSSFNSTNSYELWMAGDPDGEKNFEEDYEDFLDGLLAKRYEIIFNNAHAPDPKWWNPFSWNYSGATTLKEWGQVAQDFYEAYEWVADLDQGYRLLSDIDQIIPEQIGEEIIACTCITPQGTVVTCEEPFPGPLYDCTQTTVPIYIYHFIKNESDGTVRANSAVNVPHVGVPNEGQGEFHTFDMPGSNHIQMKNDWNTWGVFNKFVDPLNTSSQYIHFKLVRQ